MQGQRNLARQPVVLAPVANFGLTQEYGEARLELRRELHHRNA
jgi:hypothetical protein